MAVNYATVAQNEQIRQAADDNARNQYNQAKLRGEAEDRAQAAAKFAWQKTMDEAGLTGMYQGAYTMPSQQYFANTFGTWGTPTAGQQTQAAQQQAYAQAMGLTNAFGQYYAPGQAPTAGQSTLEAQRLQQQTAQNYLDLLSRLR